MAKLTGLYTAADIEAHQRHHGFAAKECSDSPTGKHRFSPDLEYDSTGKTINCNYCGEPTEKRQVALPKSRQNKTELAYGLILEAMKRRGEVVEYRFEGISLSWGADPATGKPMWYTPDFYVIRYREDDAVPTGHLPAVEILLIEVKGLHIFPKDLIRFKGCRAEWPMFQFEMVQRGRNGMWLLRA